MGPAPYASLAMYPFDDLVPAWERLWAVVHQEAPWTPADLRWTGEVQAHWRDPDCVVAHACGWPVAAQLVGRVEVVGAFTLTLPGTDGHRYRSVLLSPDPAVLDRLSDRSGPDPDLVLAANSADSLSGWISLMAALGRRAWSGPVRWTGAHVSSLAALRAGDADLACIDALSLSHLRAADPIVDGGLHQVGFGPWIPGPAIVARAGLAAAHRRDLVAGLRAAVADPAVGPVLRYDGFVELGPADYAPTTHLLPPIDPDPDPKSARRSTSAVDWRAKNGDDGS